MIIVLQLTLLVFRISHCFASFSDESCPNDVHIHLLPNYFSPQYNQSAISSISSGICRQEAHVFRVVVDSQNVTTTAQHILHTLNTKCMKAPIKVINVFEYRRLSFTLHRFERSVFVFVLADVHQLTGDLFNRRLEAKDFQRYFVVVDGLIEDDADPKRQWLRSIMEEFWEKQILNVVVIFNAGQGLEWFTYTPFTDQGVLLMEITSSDELFPNKLSNVGRSKIVITMNNDEVRAVPKSNFETEGFNGVDGMVAELIREKMNATFIYKYANEEFDGSPSTGTVGDLRSGRAVISFNAETYVRGFYNGFVETSSSFERHDICVLVPNSAPEPTLYNLMRTLTPITWLIIVASISVMVIAYFCMQYIQVRMMGLEFREQYIYSFVNALSIHFQSFFGDSITLLPTSMPLRTLIVCWCVYSFLITNAFTAKLISSLVLPRHVDDMNTLKELSDSPLNVIYPDFLNKTLWHFLEDDSTLLSSLRDQMRPVSMERFRSLINEEHYANAYIMINYAAKYTKKKHVDVKQSRSYYHLMQECLVYSPKIYTIEQGSAYLGHINELLGLFNEMGFMVKWERESMHRYTLKGKITVSEEEIADEDEASADGEGPKVVITVEHLQTAFYILALGLLLSCLGLAAEFWWFNEQRRKTLYRVVYFDKNLARQHGCNVD